MALGRKTGGRQKGTRNKEKDPSFLERLERRSRLTPKQFLLKVMEDESHPVQVRLEAAKAVAPYIHAKLSNVELSTKKGKPLELTAVPLGETLLGHYQERGLALSAVRESGAHLGRDRPEGDVPAGNADAGESRPLLPADKDPFA